MCHVPIGLSGHSLLRFLVYQLLYFFQSLLSLILCANDCLSSDYFAGICIREWDVWRPSNLSHFFINFFCILMLFICFSYYLHLLHREPFIKPRKSYLMHLYTSDTHTDTHTYTVFLSLKSTPLDYEEYQTDRVFTYLPHLEQ